MHRKPIITIISALLAIAFTVYISLDTFVISRVYVVVQPVETENETEDSKSSMSAESSESSEGAEITDTSYTDENISIRISTYREYDTDIYVADVCLADPKYLKTAFASDSFGKNITDTTSDIAKGKNAILAVNGDYYGVQEKGYVIRNGVIYRDRAKSDQDDLVIYKDGSMGIINESDVTAQELLEAGVINLLCFGPGLIDEGEIIVGESDEVDKAMRSNPRTAIGIIDENHYVFIAADGRTSKSSGLSLYELAGFMQGLGVVTGYNLDGGGSTTMYFNGSVINNPTTTGITLGKKNERKVSDIVYIGY